MSKELVCPFCQQEFREIYFNGVGVGYICPNPDCKETEKLKGNAELWQELIRTRKALDVAVDALGYYASENSWDETNRWMFVEEGFEFAKDVLDKIKALKQKESAFVHNKIEFPEYNDGLLEEFDKQFFENGQDDDLTETALEQKDVK